VALLIALTSSAAAASTAELRAGVARADITDRRAARVNDPLYAKALVLNWDATNVMLITIDAVAIGELGPIGNNFLPQVRAELEKQLLPTTITNVVVSGKCSAMYLPLG
jgi:hypothetical protein